MSEKPGLKRSLGLWAIVGLGLGYMTPTVLFDTFGIVTQETNGAVPLAYRKATTLYLRDLALPGQTVAARKNSEAFEVDRGVGLFKSTANGVVYAEGNRLKYATLQDDPKAYEDVIKYDIDTQVTFFDIEENESRVIYIKEGDLYVKDSVSSGSGTLIKHSVDQARVNQGRVYFSEGYQSFVLDFVRDVKGIVSTRITELENIESGSVLAEQ